MDGGDTLVTGDFTKDQMSKQAFDMAISQAWQDAGQDLGIRVTSPFVLKIEGNDVVFEALIRDFGGPIGIAPGPLLHSLLVSDQFMC